LAFPFTSKVVATPRPSCHRPNGHIKRMLMLRPDLGFKATAGGAHASRTVMLAELTLLLDACPEGATHAQYRGAVVDLNCLGKRSASTRTLTWGHLVDLYGMSPPQLVFRGLRSLWARDEAGRPLIALGAALARDGLLSSIAPHVWATPVGSTISRESVETFMAGKFPDRFSPAT